MEVMVKTFPGHKGRPGQVGGSVPRNASGVSTDPLNDEEKDIMHMLDMFSSMGSKGAMAYNNTYDAVKQNGKFFRERIPLPKGVRKGRMKECYRNAFNNMGGDLIYTEGLAIIEGIPFPIEHAWLTTEDGKVIDPTWDDDKKVNYFGIQFSPEYVFKVASETGYAGILANDSRNIIKKGFPAGAFYKPTETKSFPGHKGRPGKVGGSLPRNASAAVEPPSASVTKPKAFDKSSYKYRGIIYNLLGGSGKSNIDEVDPYSEVGLLSAYEHLQAMYDAYKADPETFAREGKGFSNIYYDRDKGVFVFEPIRDDESPDAPVYPERPDYDKLEDPDVVAKYIAQRDAYHAAKSVTPEELGQILEDLAPMAQIRRDYLQSMFQIPMSEDLVKGMKEYGIDILNESAWGIKSNANAANYYEALSSLFPSIEATGGLFQLASKSEIQDALFSELDAFSNTLSEDQKRNFDSWLFAVSEEYNDKQEFEIYRTLCGGADEAEAERLYGITANRSGSGDDFVHVPSTLWHATTDSDGIEANGVKSRRELGGRISEVGLGGGVDNAISFGSDMGVIKNIERALHEGHLVATGQVTIRRMLELARDGGGGVGRNWVATLFKQFDSSYETKPDHDPFKDGIPASLLRRLRVEEGLEPGSNTSDYASREGVAFEFYTHEYSGARQAAGGFPDPLFFGTMRKGLASKNPSKFKSMKFRPNGAGVKGWRMGSLSEFRIAGGENVILQEAVDFFRPEDLDAILGVMK